MENRRPSRKCGKALLEKCGGDMNALDTNVLVRLLTRDDAAQFAAVNALFTREKVWIAKTVLLETHWVLRSTFRASEESIHAVFINLLGLSNVSVEDEPAVRAALL